MADSKTSTTRADDHADSLPRVISSADLHIDVRDPDTRAAVDLDPIVPAIDRERDRRSETRRRYRVLSGFVAASDMLCVMTGFLVAYHFRFGTGQPMPISYLLLIVLAPVMWVIVFHSFGLYSLRHLSAWEEFRRVFSAVSTGVIVISLASFWTHQEFSRLMVAGVWVAALLLELGTRRVWRAYLHQLKVHGHLGLRTVIIGAGAEGQKIGERLKDPGSGFILVGHISANGANDAISDEPNLGAIDDLAGVLHDTEADGIFIAATEVDDADLLKVAQAARQQQAEMWISANMPQVLSSRLRVQPIADIMTLSLRPARLTGTQAALKRGFDLFASCLGLLILAPVIAAIAAAIKLTSRGPVFFTQYRVTQGGHVFRMYKFRTMRHDADEILAKLGIDTSAPYFKLGELDPRLTRVGSRLRRLSLDEIPQLINVVKGEMSLVGPRPLPADQVANNLSLLGPRHEVKAGVTGWWQIQGRSDVSPDDAVRMDLFYIENWSLTLDLFILLKTFGAVMAKRGAV